MATAHVMRSPSGGVSVLEEGEDVETEANFVEEGWKGRSQLGSGRGGREGISWEVGGVGGK